MTNAVYVIIYPVLKYNRLLPTTEHNNYISHSKFYHSLYIMKSPRYLTVEFICVHTELWYRHRWHNNNQLSLWKGVVHWAIYRIRSYNNCPFEAWKCWFFFWRSHFTGNSGWPSLAYWYSTLVPFGYWRTMTIRKPDLMARGINSSVQHFG